MITKLENTMFARIYLILATVTVFASANHHPKISLSPAVTEVAHFVNDSHIVTCNGHNNTRVRWLNPKDDVIENTKGRVHVEETTSGLALVFTSILLSDRGDWTCQGEGVDLRKSFNLVINQPISFMDTPIVQSARENSEALITCMVKGDPEPSVSWYYNGQILNVPSKKFTKVVDGLIIKNVSKNDSGEYTCKAFQVSTSISNVKEQTIRLNIQHKPIAPPRKASADIAFGYVHGIVNLTCEAEAEPAANFTWYRHNKKLSTRVHLIHSEGHISYLQIIVNDSKAFGEYKCKAQNGLGDLERTISLQEGIKPEKPKTVQLRGCSSDTFAVDVGAVRTSKQRHEMDINGYRFEIISTKDYRLNGGKWDKARVLIVGFEDGVTYLINNLASNTSYLLRVASRNPAGLSDWTTPKEFATHAKEPFGLMPSSAVRLSVVDSNVLLVLALTLLGFGLTKRIRSTLIIEFVRVSCTSLAAPFCTSTTIH